MKHKIIALVLVACFAVTGCFEEVLDKKPLGDFSELDVWSDGAMAEGFIMTIYADVVKGMYINQFTDDWTDDVINNSDNSDPRNFQAGNIENTLNAGWGIYGIVRECNLAIQKLEESTAIEESVRVRLLAEAKMLRAMTYGWAVRRFGGLMLIDKVLSPDDEMKLARASEAATYDFVIKDLEDAAAGLPETAEKGRLNKGAAYAFLTQVALQNNHYDLVISAANELEKLNYSLDNDYKNLFNSFTGTVGSPEVIFLYYVGKDYNRMISTRMFRNMQNCFNGEKLRTDAVPQYDPSDVFSAWPLRWPSQELVDAYLVKENETAVQRDYTYWQGKPSRDVWKNRDARFEASVVRDSARFSKSIFTFRRGGNAHWTSNPLSDWGMSKSGYMFRKWMYEDKYFFFETPIDWAEPIFRLGEVYLNKAEAYGRKGMLAEAIEYMNKTRTIHGKLPSLPGSSSMGDFWKFYKIERRVELTQEDDRYWSLIRWARAENASSVPNLDGYKLHALDMQFDGISNFVESTYTVSMRFEVPKRFFFPVPDSEIRRNEKLEQNPGWN
ncbi:MAG: RagB/SusD family nutrient uptake outer membrane protein [Mangrovibacterium sp.]